MATLNYSKKQIQPLIDKYAINAETNTTFARIIMMFDGQPNYQLWGVKAVFSKAIVISELENIKRWIDENPTLIKKLSKNGNVICYTSAPDFALLIKEIDGLSKINMVKNTINMFNTKQRKLLSDIILDDSIINGINCSDNIAFMEWYDLFSKFNKLSGSTKAKFIGRMSSVTSVSEIKRLIRDVLKEKYSWNKEDLLTYVSINTPKCDVAYDKDNIVILQVKSYDDSNSLCLGRTSWCITNSKCQWENYVVTDNNRQYFFFDFSKPEKDELAHIGFTINENIGFRAAHSTTDQNMIGEGFDYHGKKINIFKALRNAGVGIDNFIKLKPNKNYKWEHDSFVNFVGKNSKSMAIAYDKDNRVIVNAFTQEALKAICGNTCIKCQNFSPSDQTCKCYLLVDFNIKENDGKSVIIISYNKDRYGIDTLSCIIDAFGEVITNDKYLSSISIESDDFINREKVDPSIMLHKLIDEGDENAAIKLIDSNDDIDVNYEFNDIRPIFKAIDARMYRVIGKIITNKNFDCNADDGLGESLLQNLLYEFYLNNSNKMDKQKENSVREMIELIIDSNKFDLNYVNENEDTAINIACTNPNMLWLVKKLASMPSVNVNCENDIKLAAFGCAMRYRNYNAMEVIGSRPDLVILDSERQLAEKLGIDIDKFIMPKPFAETTETVVVADADNVDKYDEIFRKVFAS